jgi:hypothetical protein
MNRNSVHAAAAKVAREGHPVSWNVSGERGFAGRSGASALNSHAGLPEREVCVPVPAS